MNANDLTFGVEFETTIPRDAIPAIGSYRQGASVPWLPAGWKAKSDCSIVAGRGRIGCEFVSPVLRGPEGLRQVIEVVRALEAHGARVNRSTGFHVHVGWPGDAKALDRLVQLVANFEKAIFATTGTKSRERGRWCGGLQRYGCGELARQYSSSIRYHVLNLTNLSMGRFQTVEFRAFSGTLNERKVASYIRLCLGLVERALKAKRRTNFTAKQPVASSPIKRKGDGATELCRLFYQLGWIKGRTQYTYGDVSCDGAPSIKESKDELMRLARKYDSESEAA